MKQLAWLIVVTACASNVQPAAMKPRSATETPPAATASPATSDVPAQGGDASPPLSHDEPSAESDDGPRYADLLTGEGLNEDAEEPHKSSPPGSISLSISIPISRKQALDRSTLTAEMVVAKVQTAYFAGIKRCYKEFLKSQATARGKVDLELTVNQAGRTVNARARGFASEVDDCITAMMGQWRFPIPKDKGGDPVDTSFRITLQLAPV